LEGSEESDGLILVAREHPAINAAVRAVVARGVPVVCLTSDLPSSGRTAYVGSDQFASGSAAGWFCGRFLPRSVPGKVLFVYSVPFRCQLDREQGFRQVLRTEFAGLTIDEKVSSDESAPISAGTGRPRRSTMFRGRTWASAERLRPRHWSERPCLSDTS
jgi:LacI family transcriptional regulator